MERHYGDGTGTTEQRRWWRENRGGERGERRRHQGFKGGQEARRSHAAAFSMPARSRRGPRARLEARRRSSAVRWLPWSLFTTITKLSLDLKPKLLPNLCGNSKISKNKSCSKFKVLQLLFYNHSLIRSTFWNASLNSKGDISRIYAFSNYFKFYITTLKTPKTNFV